MGEVDEAGLGFLSTRFEIGTFMISLQRSRLGVLVEIIKRHPPVLQRCNWRNTHVNRHVVPKGENVNKIQMF